jgi:N-acetylmuramic acid 6-phosphate etherase
VIGGLKYARQVGAATIGFSCNDQSPLTDVCGVLIAPIVGPEVVSGSTRLKAGTATKMVLNMLTTGAMVLLGKTYGNLMVDLRASNEKLIDRTRRIVAMLTGISETAAEAKLLACGGDLKTAIVSQDLGITPDEARERLAGCDGHLRRALGAG